MIVKELLAEAKETHLSRDMVVDGEEACAESFRTKLFDNRERDEAEAGTGEPLKEEEEEELDRVGNAA